MDVVMPSDASHVIFNFIVFAAISILHVEFPVLSLLQYAIFTGFFLLGTLVLNPDLDTNSKSSQRCGVACKPYKWIFRHRGASHHWLWGTAACILYVALLALIVLLSVWVFGWRFSIDGGSVLTFIILHVKEFAVAIGGLFLANVFHILLDRVA